MDFKCDLQVENFDRFFALYANEITPAKKELLPSNLGFKLFKRRGEGTFYKLNFYQKWFILLRAFSVRCFFFIEDEQKGMGVEDFMKYKKRKKEEGISLEEGESQINAGVCVLGNKELIDWVSHLNDVTVSSAYNYGLKVKNTRDVDFPEAKKQFIFFANLLSNYESNKKKIIKDRGINMPDLYILQYLYDGKERAAKDTYNLVYKGAANCSRKQMMDGFKKLTQMSYIVMSGKGKNTVYKITALGAQSFGEIVQKYIVP